MDNNLPESFGRFRAEMDMAQAPKNNLAPLHLHIPEPKFRPGDVADFSDIIVPEVDANPRPDEHVMPADIHPLAYGLVRVLGYDHHASGSWNPGLDADTMRVMLRKMLLLRAPEYRIFAALEKTACILAYWREVNGRAVDHAARCCIAINVQQDEPRALGRGRL